MVDGDDCGWLCVLREVLGVQLSMGAWYGLWWVWLERCRDSSYVVNALHCDVWVSVVCMHYSVHCRWFLGKPFLVEEGEGGRGMATNV